VLQNTAALAGFSHGADGNKHPGENLHNIENATLTAVRDVNEIVDAHVRTHGGAVDPGFFLWMLTHTKTTHCRKRDP
jgi:hypothetical protein